MNLWSFKLVDESLKQYRVLLLLKRYKSKKSASYLKKKKGFNACELALQHFDDFYKSVFQDKWPSVRLGLLSKQKYFAVINNFGEVEETEKYLKNEGAFDLKSFLEVQKGFLEEPSKKNTLKKKNKTELDDVIKQQFYEKQEKDSLSLHPEGMEFQSKVERYTQQDTSEDKEYFYKPEDARTALDSDLKSAEMDLSRLIIPGSDSEANLLEFIPSTKLRGAEGYIAESDYYKYYNVKSQSLPEVEDENEFDFPEHLKVYSFDRGEISDFSDPTKSINDVYNYLKVDGAELLTALALGVKPKDTVLDMCSNSENIVFCILQTLYPKYLVCSNDIHGNTEEFFSQYLCDNSPVRNEILFISSNCVDETESSSMFHKVLVNVSSTDDRTSLFEEDNNIFSKINIRKRLQLPEVQCSLLVKGMKLVQPGGTVVYTTSTLSPVQNEGVVNEALKIMMEENRVKFIVKNLSPALKHTSMLFNFGDYLNMKYGILVVPYVPVNFGPRYICKLVRSETQEEKEEKRLY